MTEYTLSIPQKALDEIQRQLDEHNESTGAELQLKPYLERVVLEIAGMPALRARIPQLELERDAAFQAATKQAQAEISRELGGPDA